MQVHRVPEYRLLFTVDIEDYSGRNDREQHTLQAALDQMLANAADTAELDRAAWKRQEGGDGIYAVLPLGADVTHLMDVFVRELDAGLGAYNRRRSEPTWTRIRLRMAVHVGPMHVDGAMGWPGQHAVQPARLRDSKPIRIAMQALPAADLAVIVSNEIYRDYITQGLGEPRPNAFRPVQVTVKRQAYLAYLYVPGFDLGELPELAVFAPPSDGEGGDLSPRSPEPVPPAAAPVPREPAPDGRQVNVTYGSGDAFSGDKLSGDKNIYYGGGRDGR